MANVEWYKKNAHLAARGFRLGEQPDARVEV
jgi:hypothetical protein